MKVKQIVEECIVKMGLDNFINNQTYTADEQKIIDRLVFNVNVVYREIVTSYLPLIDSREVQIEGGEYVFADLTGVRMLYPVRLEAGDKEIKFKTYATKLKCDYEGRAKLYFAYLPSEDFVISDEIDDTRITSQVMCAGVLAEYYFQNKVFDLAKSFDLDYRAGLSVLKYKGRSMFLNVRRW